MKRRLTSIVLALCLVISIAVSSTFVTNAAQTKGSSVGAASDVADTGASYGLASKIEDGNILHCFN